MKQRKPLTPAALDRIYGARLIKAAGFDRSAILKFARAWMRDQQVSWGHAQRHAWAVARGQMDKARAFDAAPRPAQIEWRMAA
ncbi:hypothetical protein [Methylocystis sp. S23]